MVLNLPKDLKAAMGLLPKRTRCYPVRVYAVYMQELLFVCGRSSTNADKAYLWTRGWKMNLSNSIKIKRRIFLLSESLRAFRRSVIT